MLRLVVEETKTTGAPLSIAGAATVSALEAVRRTLVGARRIERTADCKVFAIEWPGYIAHSVRAESYTARDEYEQSEGRLLRRFTRSRFLDYLRAATIEGLYSRPVVHFAIVCSDHIIDVASADEPLVRVL